MLREDMDSLGPIKIKEVEAAQQQIHRGGPSTGGRRSGEPEGNGGRKTSMSWNRPHRRCASRRRSSGGSLETCLRAHTDHRHDEQAEPDQDTSVGGTANSSSRGRQHQQGGSGRGSRVPARASRSRSAARGSRRDHRRTGQHAPEVSCGSRAIDGQVSARHCTARAASRAGYGRALLGLVKAAFEKMRFEGNAQAAPPRTRRLPVREHRRGDSTYPAIRGMLDASLTRGSVIFETSRGDLDASLDTQFIEIERGLTDVLKRRNG